MNEQLKNGLLTLAIEVYQVGYLLLAPDLHILAGNAQVTRWLEEPLVDLLGATSQMRYRSLSEAPTCCYS